MAQKIITVRTDDLTGEQLEPGAGQTLEFSVGTANYRMDLSDENAQKFSELIAPYVEKATRVRKTGVAAARKPRAASGTSTGKQSDAMAIRQWAAENGIEVPARGRIPSELREQFMAANPDFVASKPAAKAPQAEVEAPEIDGPVLADELDAETLAELDGLAAELADAEAAEDAEKPEGDEKASRKRK